jgi:prepilin-type processing-associated H-X9-DG protein
MTQTQLVAHPQSWGWRDEDGSRLPSTYHLLKEGIERFFITDINNPAAGAKAQSEVFVMWDDAQVTDISRFNHVPGGGNVLYMDGHVEFIRYPGETPFSRNWVRLWGGEFAV